MSLRSFQLKAFHDFMIEPYVLGMGLAMCTCTPFKSVLFHFDFDFDAGKRDEYV